MTSLTSPAGGAGRQPESSAWRRLRATAALALTLSLAACGAGGGGGSEPPPAPPPPPPPATGSVAGQAVSAGTGAPLAGATVRVGSLVATADDQGRFTLGSVAPGAVVLAVSASDHAPQFLNATVAASQTAQAGVARLTAVGARQTYAAADGATVVVAGSPAQVVLPPGGIATAAGAAYSGPVSVTLTPIDPAADIGNMPGNLASRASDGSLQPIESFGAIHVVLTDASGNRLNLAAGRSATIRIPLSTRSPNPPATIPLYWFNEGTGLWVQEGEATLAGTAPQQYYEGTVSHFTFWNADQPYNTITVTGCVQEESGARVAGATVRSEGLDYSGRDSVLTDGSGSFTVAMRRASRASIDATLAGRASNAVVVGPSESSITLQACLVLGNGAPVFVEQPLSQSVTEGGWALFRAVARGTPPIRYQWQRNGVNIPGATASLLLVDPARNEDNGAVYRVVATNSAGAANSQNATLTVAQLPPLIVGQPQGVTVQAGGDATFSVQVAAQGAPLAFQWLRNNQVIAGATSSSYTLTPAQLSDSGASFSVRVSNAVGQVVSQSAPLVVTPLAVAPQIVGQPQLATVTVGQTAQFAVTATGSAPLTYQWRRNGTPIAGANDATLTLPGVTLADSGAQFTVVVSNSAGSASSDIGRLIVLEPTPAPGAGHHLLGTAGARVGSAVVFANGSQTFSSAALVAVPADAPASAGTVEVAGAATDPFASVIETRIQGTQVSQTRERLSFYFKGGRLQRLDLVSPGGLPQPQTISSLTTSQVCGQAGYPVQPDGPDTLSNLAQPLQSWVLLVGPGPDAQCGNGDDVTLAVRADDTAETAPRVLAGVPLLEIVGADGSLQGAIVREGLLLRRVDAQLQNPVTLHTLARPLDFGDDFVFGPTLPGAWLFVDNGRLYGVRLDGSGTPVLLDTFSADEAAAGSWRMVGQGGRAYVVIASTERSRILRVDASLNVTAAGTGPADFVDIVATPTRLIFQQPQALRSQPLDGGTAITLLSSEGPDLVAPLFAAGETLYLQRTDIDAAFNIVSSVQVLQSDGSNLQTLPGTAIVTVMVPAVAALETVFDTNFYAVTVAIGLTPEGWYAGGTLRTLEGATRQTLVTHGTLPSDVPVPLAVYPGGFAPFHYGQAGLLSMVSFAGQEEIADLLHFDSNAVGVTRVTQGIATPASAGVRPLALRPAARPGVAARVAGDRGLAHKLSNRPVPARPAPAAPAAVRR